MNELTFQAENHRYLDGERELMSVTQLLEWCGLAKDLSFLKLDAVYRHRGEAVHGILEMMDRGQDWAATWGHPSLLPYAKQIEAFKRDTKFQGRLWEIPFAWRKRGIAGKLDVLGDEIQTASGPEIWLLDAKTGALQELAVACQLNGYKELILNGEVIESADLDYDYEWLNYVKKHGDRIRLKSLNLKADGGVYTLRSHDEPRFASYWKSAVTLYGARKEYGLL